MGRAIKQKRGLVAGKLGSADHQYGGNTVRVSTWRATVLKDESYTGMSIMWAGSMCDQTSNPTFGLWEP